MAKHIKNYRKYFNIGDQDVLTCSWCNMAQAVDLHHIVYRSSKGTDEVANIIALCRSCHEKAHKRDISESDLLERQKQVMRIY